VITDDSKSATTGISSEIRYDPRLSAGTIVSVVKRTFHSTRQREPGHAYVLQSDRHRWLSLPFVRHRFLFSGGQGMSLHTLSGHGFATTLAIMAALVPGVEIVQGQTPQGSIVAWGWNDYGQTNVPVPNASFVAIAAGQFHSLGLKADGSVAAWGCGSPWDFGQCNVLAPNSGFVAIVAGDMHSLGLKVDGSIVAWGRNEDDQTDVPAPNTSFIAIAAGFEYSLGLKADGSIVAWGRNDLGQGDVPVTNTGFVGVTAGAHHSLGLKVDGSIVAWGYNDSGQTDVPAPNSGFIAIAAGRGHSLGLKVNGSIVAWGSNGYGLINVPAPNSGFVAIAAGYIHNLGLKSDGSIVAWGRDNEGQANVPAPNSGFTAVAASVVHSLGLQIDGACCLTNGSCWQLGKNECSAQGGLWHGPGSNCQSDRDGDSIADVCDNCVDTPNAAQVDFDGDGLGDLCDDDEDNDGIVNDYDSCPGTPVGIIVGPNGCPLPFGPCCFEADVCISDVQGNDCALVGGNYIGDGLTCDGDSDLDGVVGCNDRCPLDRDKTAPGFCGCGVPEGDRDGDGVCDAVDRCPLDNPDDSDGDGVCDSADPCPFDNPDDTDGDWVCDSDDGCPNDPAKSEPGACGCGVLDDDGDADGIADCIDLCPNTPANVPVNRCGCTALGACCFSVGVCFNGLIVDTCETIEGVYQGDGSACSEGCGFGDFDGDGAVELRDFAVFQRCFGANKTEIPDDLCARGDIDRCQDIDLWDYAAFRRAMTGP